MTERRFPDEMARPRRQAGEHLRNFLRCPYRLCQGELRVVAYRKSTTRFECRDCGLRFSLDPAAFASAAWDAAQRLRRGDLTGRFGEGFADAFKDRPGDAVPFIDGLIDRLDLLMEALPE